MKKYILCFTMLGICSCTSLPAHQHLVGRINIVDPGGEGTVCMEGVDAQVGQKVSVVERVCAATTYKTRWAIKNGTSCEEIPRVEAKIISNSNIHEVTIRSLVSTELKSGYTVKIIK